MLIIRGILLFVLVGILSGCVVSPQTLGISSQKWQSYSPQQQKKLRDSYHKIKNYVTVDNSSVAVAKIKVAIKNGAIMLPPFVRSYSYSPVQFDINRGECKDVGLYNPKFDKKVKMGACFSGKVLYLDPSRYDVTKQKGSIRLYVTPLWQRGFTYKNINSSGYVRLQNADITITAKGENHE